MLRGSRQLESLAGQQLIACTGETFPADLTIAANHLTHLLGPNFNFTTLWADGHQTFQLLPDYVSGSVISIPFSSEHYIDGAPRMF